MKKNILFCALALSLTLTACGSKQTTTSITAPNKQLSADTSAADDTNTEVSDEATDNTEDAAGTISPTDAAAENTVQENSQILTDSTANLPTDSIGSVSFGPNADNYPMVSGSTTLNAYFQRPNVVGAGKLTIHNASDDSIAEEINLADKRKCTAVSDDSTLTLLGWSAGTRLAINLKEPLTAGASYYVTLSEGAFKSSDGTIASKAVDNKNTWSFSVAEYGIKLAVPSGSDVFVDDVLKADIIISKPVDCVKIENYDENRVRFNEKEFEESGKLEIKIHQIGEDPFTVNFYDEEDDIIGSVTVTYTASLRPDPKEELKKPTISKL